MEESKRVVNQLDDHPNEQNTSNKITNCENNLFKGKIKLDIPMYTIAFVSFIYPPLVGVFCLILYILEGRVAGYFPTISETATDYPNNKLFAQFNSIGSLTTMATLFFYFNSFVLERRSKNKELKPVQNEKTLSFEKNFSTLEKVLRVFMYFSSIGTVALGLSPINEAHSRHLLSAVTGFMSILIFELITFFTDPFKSNIQIKILRWTAWTIAFLSFGLFAAAKWVFSHRIDVTISTFAEWLLLFFMLFVWSTWRHELKSIEFSLVIL